MLTKLREYNLQGNLNLACITYNDEEDWLAKRTLGVGGSDMGGLMGISKYSSPLKVYKSKFDPEPVDSVAIRKGKDLEPVIRDVYVIPYLNMLGYDVKHPDVMFINNGCPWLIANLDGIAIPKEPASYRDNVVIEIKWVSENGELRWNGEEYCGVPAEYYAQVQHYMCVTGAQEAIICALFDSTWEMHYYKIPYDMTFVMKMLDTSEHFYKYNMAHKIPPAPDTTVDRDELRDEVLDGIPEPTEYSEKVTEWCAEYTALKEQLASLELDLKELSNKIVKAYQEGEMPEKPFKVRLSTYKRMAFDGNALRNDHPTLYEQYLRHNDCLRITIGKTK